jgi:hypothetical protein
MGNLRTLGTLRLWELWGVWKLWELWVLWKLYESQGFSTIHNWIYQGVRKCKTEPDLGNSQEKKGHFNVFFFLGFRIRDLKIKNLIKSSLCGYLPVIMYQVLQKI